PQISNPECAWTVADGEGRWSLRLALPSGFRGVGLETEARWRFGDASASVTVDDVREGRPLALTGP
ncbi:MAG TPA: hypothetical protein VGE37_00720, partial [Archangium sp.]